MNAIELYCPHCGQAVEVIEQKDYRRSAPSQVVICGTCANPACILFRHTLSAASLRSPERLAKYGAALLFDPASGIALSGPAWQQSWWLDNQLWIDGR